MKKPHIFMHNGRNGYRWRYIPASGVSYNDGVNAAANDFCAALNHRQFGDRLF